MNEKVKGEARRKIILDGYVNNEPLKDIAAKLGCSLASLKVSASKLGCTRAPKEAADFRRGFRIPDNKRQDYYQLMRAGQYRSRDCAQILGLLTTQSPSME
ncbi:MAG: hypothetical protein EOQ55_25190 [Mesorhizobium sp.]|uniref:hypothetical protein n=1 Tax=unclassified Mesorhizobium TaxID=325217 RepID=UPI000FCB24D5|nr:MULTISPECIES: hypothetical protein [unclassified Mesorhizobium]MDG4886182.1 hypothetical protein [Mesorhizobium sp. WSM4887]RUV40337.1 hypothetical protein EOD29_28280 [Mesorhizobium sp. M1A.T.Ca.IN.004.03.1.1]RWG13664.1 MAG: hypothetical protein EOQ55_25190 [Mesorhizobium sp.]RWI91105.1 MAG: hypothetical protein EOR21_22340 [Mesorhizobium sp.]RWK37420.1 MAG: hypothetical protein EOR40_10790 [Mesorhizobium sp.]